ncbi:replication initiation protein [Pandoraea sp. NPDC090278]|uniref:replication initiation protein n=1 Tax=Pandoraea sp. NPDC090278 TaxID=3364391 RepID=UPI00383BBBBC
MAKKNTDSQSNQLVMFPSDQVPVLFKKAVEAIQIAPKKGTITLQQQRGWNMLIRNANKQNADFLRTTQTAPEGQAKPLETFSISLKSVREGLRLSNSNNREYIKDTVSSLVGIVVSWNVLNESGQETEWTASGLLASATIRGGTLEYTFSEQVRQIVTNPTMFAYLDENVEHRFRSPHSLTLWQNVVRYENLGRTKRFDLKTFRKMFVGEDGAKGVYKEYKVFKRSVLAPAIAEVNASSNHVVSMTEFKEGRSVVELQFSIVEKQAAPSTDDQDAVSKMVAIGVKQADARTLFSRYGAEKVDVALNYVEDRRKRQDQQPIANLSAYFKKALSQGWTLDVEDVSNARKGGSSAGADQGTDDAQREVRELYMAAQIDEAKAYFEEIADNEREAVVIEYNEQQSIDRFRLSSKRRITPAAERSFLQWLAYKVWGEPTSEDLLKFVLTSQKR